MCLPSVHHSPPPVDGPPRPEGVDNGTRWDVDAQWWNSTWSAGLNAQRMAIGLDPVTDVHAHVLTDRPLLAADPTLAPWPSTDTFDVVQTGAWLQEDPRPLSDDVQRFLDAGEPPILFGLGSILKPRVRGQTMLEAARQLRRRAIILRGWAGITADGAASDWLSVGETNLQALLTRVAAVVHHGGAGTTTQALQSGAPQVVVPHHFDQPYHGHRICELGVGRSCPGGDVTVDSLRNTLDRVLADPVRARARALAGAVRTDGTAVAAQLFLHR